MNTKHLSIFFAIPYKLKRLTSLVRVDCIEKPLLWTVSDHKIPVVSLNKRQSRMFSSTINKPTNGIQGSILKKADIFNDKLTGDIKHEYQECIKDLNLLQSNTQTIALAKYKNPAEILPLFIKQLNLAGIALGDLDKLNIIHVSGTKGKGSTCAFVDSILRESGKKVGFYNSPHLIKVTERIKIDGASISDEKFSVYFRKVYERLSVGTAQANITMPSYFSFLTILAFHIFIEEKVDCAIIEVGIGGEFDPTNIVQKPVACGITTIDYDHTNILGDTIEKITWSKAGIAKKGRPLFTIQQEHKVALEVIESRAKERGCPVFVCKPLDKNTNFRLGIHGSVQYNNAALAFHLSSQFLDSVCGQSIFKNGDRHQEKLLESNLVTMPSFVSQALSTCSWPGRCQILRYPQVLFFLDGAHTHKSMENCVDWFQTSSEVEDPNAVKILLVNIIGNRDKRKVLSPLCQVEDFDQVIFSSNKINSAAETPKSETFINGLAPNDGKNLDNAHLNASTWTELRRDHNKTPAKIVICPNTSDCIKSIKVLSRANPERNYHVLVTGSLHFVGAISETLLMTDAFAE